MKRNVILLIISFFIVLSLIAFQVAEFSDKRLYVVFCDVGQGDAIYIRTPTGADILVDGGRDSKVMDCLSSHMPLWDRKLELVFATHPDSDHIGGLVNVLRSYDVDSFNSVSAEKDSKTFDILAHIIKEKSIPYRDLKTGDKFSTSDGVELLTLWPEKDFSSSNSNDYSLVQVLSFGELDVLLTGDVPYEELNELPIDGEDIEVFKLPHHGSKTGVNAFTMAKIKAKMAIISAGKNNPYHHPSPEVVDLLKEYKMPYLRTDERGTIEIVSDGHEIKVVPN